MSKYQESTSTREIAIIGIGCRFPGAISGPDKLWQFLLAGKSNVTELSNDRFPVDELFCAANPNLGKIQSKYAACFDKEQLERFDHRFFGISPREAERMDPQQRLMLEVSWEALEDAGVPPDTLYGGRTGVFAGLWDVGFEHQYFESLETVDRFATTGTSHFALSGRISYVLGLQGPSITLNTACSTSLVAVHLACTSILNGECGIALAGGVNLILRPHYTVSFSQSGLMAPDGRCKFGDKDANGFVRGEGGAVVVLKSLDQAIADNDRIYATILGSDVNNDGRTGKHFVTPGIAGQKEVLHHSWHRANVRPSDLNYIEAHGTGTAVGDKVELTAIAEMLTVSARDEKCLIGSIKTNIGHLESGAGIAGLIKAALIAKHRVVPASLHVKTLNPAVDWETVPLAIATETLPLPASSEGRSYLGVTSFGISGTNAHVVLSTIDACPDDLKIESEKTMLFPFSGRSEAGLKAVLTQSSESLRSKPLSIQNLSFTLSQKRSHLTHRAIFRANSQERLLASLEGYLAGDENAAVHTGRTLHTDNQKVVWLCTDGMHWSNERYSSLLMQNHLVGSCHVALEDLAKQAGINIPGHDGDVDEPNYKRRLIWQQIVWGMALREAGILPKYIISDGVGRRAAAFLSGEMELEDTLLDPDEAPFFPQKANLNGSDQTTQISHLSLDHPQAQALLEHPIQWLPIGPSHCPDRIAETVGPSGSHNLWHDLEDLTQRWLAELGALYVLGILNDWSPAQETGKLLDWPTYPWQGERIWFNDTGASFRDEKTIVADDFSPVFGVQLPSSAHRPNEHIWQRVWSGSSFRDQLGDPDSLQRALLETVASRLPDKRLQVESLDVDAAIEIADRITVQLIVIVDNAGEAQVGIYGQRRGANSWQRYVSSRITTCIEYPLPESIREQYMRQPAHRRFNWLQERVSQQIAIAEGRRPTDTVNGAQILKLTAASSHRIQERLNSLMSVDLKPDAILQNPSAAQITQLLIQSISGAPAQVEAPILEESVAIDEVADQLAQLLDELQD